MLNRYLASLSLLIFSLNLTGCATTPTLITPRPEGIPGIYHKVERGQTLWGISKIYNIDLNEIVKVNNVSDATNIETGRLIFIPNRKEEKQEYSSANSEDFIWPLKGRVISAFGQTANNMINKGINIKANEGTDIIASRSGKVVFYSPDFSGFGKTIIIDHGDGFSTVYARNSAVFIKTGELVKKGMLIAKVGSAGRDKDTYLHFEIRKGHLPQNPYYYLAR